MNLVAYSVRTKGLRNFLRRITKAFTRFGRSGARTRRALQTIIDALRSFDTAPTFFVPAVVLRRHVPLITNGARTPHIR
jgi:hypothetical protein